MKKIASLLLVSLLVVGLFTGCMSSRRDELLKVYTWADYNYDGIEDDFSAYYKQRYGKNINVDITTFSTPEEMLTKIEAGKEDFDLACPSDYMIEQMISKKLLLPIETNTLDNYGNLSPYIVQQHNEFENLAKADDDNNTYSVSYMWGTMGFIYNEDAFDDITVLQTDWSQLFDSDNKGKVLIKDSMRDTYVITSIQANKEQLQALDKNNKQEYLSSLTKIINDTSSENIAKVENLLKDMKQQVSPVFEVDEGKGKMTTGQFNLGVAWSGDAIWSIEEAGEDVNLGYIIPEIGSNVWFDGWVIPKYARNVPAAHSFIDFLLQSDTTILNMEETGYTSGVATTEIIEWLEEYADGEGEEVDLSYFFSDNSNVIIPRYMYPSATEIEYCAIMADFKDNTGDISKMWLIVKTNSLESIMITMLIIISLTIAAGIAYYFIKRHKAAKKKIKNVHKTTPYRP